MQEKSYVISVSVGTGCYRHIKLSSQATLLELHEEILYAFEFFDDHAHAFFMDNVAWSDRNAYFCDFIEDEDKFTKDYTLEKLGLDIGVKFKYVFDFGDDWQFQCKVLKILDEKTEEPEVVRTKGEPPSQYDYDDDAESGEDDDAESNKDE